MGIRQRGFGNTRHTCLTCMLELTGSRIGLWATGRIDQVLTDQSTRVATRCPRAAVLVSAGW